MMWPPSIMSVRIRRFRLWLPIILVWLVAAAIWIVALPLLLLCAILTGQRRYVRSLLLIGPAVFRLFSALRGLTVEVQARSDRVFIAFR